MSWWPQRSNRPSGVWVFDVAWALVIFFGLRSVAARLLAVRLGLAMSLVCGTLGIGVGLGLQRALAGDSSGAATVLGLRVVVAVTHDPA